MTDHKISLVADIGGTNARFACVRDGQLSPVAILPGKDYPDIEAAIRTYLQQEKIAQLAEILIAIANPIQGDLIKMTNHDWSFSIARLKNQLKVDKLTVINDFTALAYALPHLASGDLLQIGQGRAMPNEVCALIGAGTGLGVSGIVPSAGRWIALHSEGGHVSFSPGSELEIELLQWTWQQLPHVSAERFLSGPGLSLIHRGLAQIKGIVSPEHTPREISAHAKAKTCTLCMHSVQIFSAMLGTAAGNLGVTLGSRGGVFIGGGVVGKLAESFDQALFRQRFEAKGRFEAYLQNMPTFLIQHPYPTFLGLKALLD